MREEAALEARTFAADVLPQIEEAAATQARREATPLLNTPASRKDRYEALTPLTPTVSPLATESRRRRDHHAEWHAQRALEPTLDALFTADREPELLDTAADPAAVGLAPSPRAATPPIGASRASRGGAPPRAFLGGIPLGGQRPLV